MGREILESRPKPGGEGRGGGKRDGGANERGWMPLYRASREGWACALLVW